MQIQRANITIQWANSKKPKIIRDIFQLTSQASETLVSLNHINTIRKRFVLMEVDVLSMAAWFGVGIGVAAAIGLFGKSKRKK
ncbi:hypothetical protein [Neobacillus soli]|uniref:hypothetical protein n=1 Tax=Neobacillus soli TaxID=220688 RepID=UPI00082705A7|nr:hypothetical protein [Neobacillus soli]